MLQIVNTIEAKRGCGWRKPGANGVGVYLMGGELSAPCGRLPVPLLRCPTCDCGIKPSRSWTWIEPAGLFRVAREQPCGGPAPIAPTVDPSPLGRVDRFRQRMSDWDALRKVCALCPIGDAMPLGRHGLLWIGEAFYKSPHDFVREAAALGLSRKLPALPRGFELGKTWVYLAHRAAVQKVVDGAAVVQPGVFSAFKPHRIDLVVDTDDPAQLPERARKLAEELIEAHGESAVRLVKVTRDVDAQLGIEDAKAAEPAPGSFSDYTEERVVDDAPVCADDVEEDDLEPVEADADLLLGVQPGQLADVEEWEP